MNKSILYVSKYSEPSMKFLNEFQKVPMSKSFEIYYVENILDNLHEDVDCVPYLHIPVLDQPLKGSSAFKWLKQISKGISINNEKMNYTPQIEKKQIQNQSENNNDIKDFDSTMSSGFSDDFSFISGDSPQKHSFEFLQNTESDTMNISNNTSQKNSKEDLLTKRMQELQKERSEIYTI